jgi:hypothetical protein
VTLHEIFYLKMPFLAQISAFVMEGHKSRLEGIDIALQLKIRQVIMERTPRSLLY